jgi:2-oxoglutarate ferredoxin oxidoreductase subunit beta
MDVISPCVPFNDHARSTKSYDYVREHNQAVNRRDFWTRARRSAPRLASSAFRKLATDRDPTDKVNATTHIARAAEKGEVLTGLLDPSTDSEGLHAHLNPTRGRSTRFR